MTLIELARKLRPYIEKAAASLSDEDALEAVNLFPTWDSTAEIYSVGDRVLYNDILYKCLQSHTPQSNWNPETATSLWAKVLIPDANVIPEWEQPESTNPYMAGDRVMFEGHIYESAFHTENSEHKLAVTSIRKCTSVCLREKSRSL